MYAAMDSGVPHHSLEAEEEGVDDGGQSIDSMVEVLLLDQALPSMGHHEHVVGMDDDIVAAVVES